MNLEIINPFLAGAYSVLESLLRETPTKGELRLQSDSSTSCQVNVVIGITGNITGNVVFGMSLNTADAIASTMVGQPVKTFDKLAASAIGELANMISGNGLQRLSKMGVVCDIAPPTIIRGTQICIDTVAIPALVVPILVTQGEIVVTFMLQGVK